VSISGSNIASSCLSAKKKNIINITEEVVVMGEVLDQLPRHPRSAEHIVEKSYG
jgi:hypothetical protein